MVLNVEGSLCYKFQFLALTGLSVEVFDGLLTFLNTYNVPVLLRYAGTNNQSCDMKLKDQLLLALAKLRSGETDMELSITFQVE